MGVFCRCNIGYASIFVLLGTQLLFMDGILVDELNLGEGTIRYYVFIAIVGVSFLNIISYFISKNKD